jgi:hypothetical protein
VALHDYRDGPLVLALCRESVRTARRLEGGRTVSLSAEQVVPAPAGAARADPSRIRWFLREGWLEGARYGHAAAVMAEPRAAILLPVLRPEDLELTLAIDTPESTALSFLVNGRPAAEAGRSADGSVVVRIPRALLFRGDNLMTMTTPRFEGVRLRTITCRPLRPAAAAS